MKSLVCALGVIRSIIAAERARGRPDGGVWRNNGMLQTTSGFYSRCNLPDLKLTARLVPAAAGLTFHLAFTSAAPANQSVRQHLWGCEKLVFK